MQLTPRSLAMACAALLVGGTAFGIVTTLAPAVGGIAIAPTPSPSASDMGDVGDEFITYPLPSLADTTVPSSSTSAAASREAVTPTPTNAVPVASPEAFGPAVAAPSTAPSPIPSPRITPAPAPAPSSSSSPRPRPARSPSAKPHSRPVPRPAATAGALMRAAPTPRRGVRATEVVDGWRAPVLHLGANVITLPRLSSGARAQVTVACSPSNTCQMSGDQLVIEPSAVSVTVTWWAPARGTYRAWGTSRGL